MVRYHLVYKNDYWVFEKAGSTRSIKRFLTKTVAKEWAIVYIKNTGFGGSLVIHGQDGKIQEERTYPRTSDPRKSKG